MTLMMNDVILLRIQWVDMNVDDVVIHRRLKFASADSQIRFVMLHSEKLRLL